MSRKPPQVSVRRPPQMPGLEVLDPAETAAFVGGKPREHLEASVPQPPESSGHQGTEASEHQGLEEPPQAIVPAEPLGAETPEHQGTGASGHRAPDSLTATPQEGGASGSSGKDASAPSDESTGAPKHRGSKAPRHQSTTSAKAPGKGRGLVERAGGKAARRVIAYLDPALAKKLAIRALNEDSDMSALINEAVRRFMAG